MITKNPSKPAHCLAALFAAITITAASAQTGTGLTGQYYDTNTFTSLLTTRTDATVDFNWGTAIPSGTALTNADTFSVIWTGQIEPEFSENYTFLITADDFTTLWVDDQVVSHRGIFQSGIPSTGQIRLKAGKKTNIRVEYIEQTGPALIKLEWASPSRPREVIPTSRLYPTRAAKAGGSLMKEHWTGIAGGSISSLTGNANYPNKPGGREFITNFECLAQDWADSYGTRVTGFIVPPVSGSYTFATSGDEVVELYLSTDATAANKSPHRQRGHRHRIPSVGREPRFTTIHRHPARAGQTLLRRAPPQGKHRHRPLERGMEKARRNHLLRDPRRVARPSRHRPHPARAGRHSRYRRPRPPAALCHRRELCPPPRPLAEHHPQPGKIVGGQHHLTGKCHFHPRHPSPIRSTWTPPAW